MLAPLGWLERASDADTVAIHGLGVFDHAQVRDGMRLPLVPVSESEAACRLCSLGDAEDVMKPEYKKEVALLVLHIQSS